MQAIVRMGMAVALALVASCGSGESEVVETNQAPAAGSTSMTSASCVEQYSLDSLEKRDYAFDGTVKSIEHSAADEPDRVTFEVHAWYKGGSGAETVRQASGFGAITSAGGQPREVGERMLVAGDDDFAWDCGFTQPYDAEVAADWKERLS